MKKTLHRYGKTAEYPEKVGSCDLEAMEHLRIADHYPDFDFTE